MDRWLSGEDSGRATDMMNRATNHSLYDSWSKIIMFESISRVCLLHVLVLYLFSSKSFLFTSCLMCMLCYHSCQYSFLCRAESPGLERFFTGCIVYPYAQNASSIRSAFVIYYHLDKHTVYINLSYWLLLVRECVLPSSRLVLVLPQLIKLA